MPPVPSRVGALVALLALAAHTVSARSLFPPPVPHRDSIVARIADVRRVFMRGVRGGGEQRNGKSTTLDLKDIGYDFRVPIIVLQGRHDLHTPYEPCTASFERIRAPHKRFITFERSAHHPMFEESGHCLMTLVNEVLPLSVEHPVFRVLP